MRTTNGGISKGSKVELFIQGVKAVTFVSDGNAWGFFKKVKDSPKFTYVDSKLQSEITKRYTKQIEQQLVPIYLIN